MNRTRMRNRRLPLWQLLGTAVLLVGCAGGSTEHAGHHEPEHKPRNLDALVGRLEALHQRFTTKHLDESGPGGIRCDLEFCDLVDWLDEFAADSDLNETGWRRCRELKRTMAARFGDPSENAEGFAQRYADQSDDWGQDIAALRSLVQSAKTNR